MPKTPIDYSTVYFYKIVCKDLSIEDCYVGSTTNFTKRKNSHKKTSRLKDGVKYNYKIYQFIRNNGTWDNFDMVLIETGTFENSLEVKKRERELIEELKATLNGNVPSRSFDEYRKTHYQNNKEKIKEYKQKYYIEHKDNIIQKWHASCNCSCGGSYSLNNKEKHFKTQRHQKYLQQQETPETATPDSD